MIQIKLTSLQADPPDIVVDQEKPLRFYTEILGFVKKQHIPKGQHHWPTVVSASDPDGVEIVREPNAFPAKSLPAGVVRGGHSGHHLPVAKSEPRVEANKRPGGRWRSRCSRTLART